MIYKNRAEAKRLTGLAYVGMVNNSAKHEKAYHYNEMVYTIYLAPAKSSGYEVCPGRTAECTAACLNMSGRNIMDVGREVINGSRIKKTKLIFEEKEFITRWIIDEITAAKAKAEKQGFRFSVRLNNTSDISPEDFYITDNGVRLNLLEIFSDVQFYDYSKISSRIHLMNKYDNYDITYSFNGHNWESCEIMLKNNVRVCVVFDKVPESYMGYKVINADLYDMRYLDPTNVICGVKFKKVRNKLDKNSTFVIREKDLILEEAY
jgi:hypothetical protein